MKEKYILGFSKSEWVGWSIAVVLAMFIGIFYNVPSAIGFLLGFSFGMAGLILGRITDDILHKNY